MAESARGVFIVGKCSNKYAKNLEPLALESQQLL